MIQKTDCINLTDDEIINISTESLENESQIREYIFDMSQDADSRLKMLNLYYEKFGEEVLEIVNKMNGMYLFSGTELLKNFLSKICIESTLSDYLKIESAKCMAITAPEDYGYSVLLEVIQEIKNQESEITATCLIDAIFYLAKCEKYITHSYKLLSEVVNNQDLDCLYRYKTILSIENRIQEKYQDEYIKNVAFSFCKNEKNFTKYRIISAQLILRITDLDAEILETVETYLSEFAQDEELCFEVRADASDVLLQFGSKASKEFAQQMILLLGNSRGEVRNIYENAENAHNVKIEESVNVSLISLQNQKKEDVDWSTIYNQINAMVISPTEKLKKLEEKRIRSLNRKKNVKIRFKEHIKKIKKQCKNVKGQKKKRLQKKLKSKINVKTFRTKAKDKDELQHILIEVSDEDKNKVIVALNRIEIDRALYGSVNLGLMNITSLVWDYIHHSEDKDELLKRLVEELIDMSGKCSTGFAHRLVNTLSGFSEFSLQISWEDQIISNLTGKLNKKIQEIKDDDYMNNILTEMAIPNKHYHLRKNFLQFFRENVTEIRRELFYEFIEHLNEQDFDMYFRKAIYQYEGYF